MSKQAYNPYLPSYEYVPDAEPYVFGDRVYIYGSHDKFNAPIFCMNDYICWSAPVDDLSKWEYEGVIYKKNQDPKNKLGLRLLFAPDVTVGPDGRYYLYYAFDFMGLIGVAVCDTPAGKYQFYGHIKYPSGKLFGRRRGDPLPFDPGVLVDDDNRVYLYSGFYMTVPQIVTGGIKLKSEGGVVLELEQDMLTIKEGPNLIFPKEGNNAFQNHEFFEASSVRKIEGRYYFVYSSRHNHELCYAVSDNPMNGFTYGGTLVSQGDLFLNGNEDESKATNYLGNTHGGMVNINGQWYIFYHRQTNRHSYSRQACAEKLIRSEDGRFLQAEVTSCGLNNGLLKGFGKYEARIACNLWSIDGTGRYDCKKPRKQFDKHPYFTQSGKDRENNPDQHIANFQDGAVAGFKYFDIKELISVAVELRGDAVGEFQVSDSADFKSIAARITVMLNSQDRVRLEAPCIMDNGKRAIYFRFLGKGCLDFLAFELLKQE